MIFDSGIFDSGITHTSAIAAGAIASFTVNLAGLADTDVINLNLKGGQATVGTYRYWVDVVLANSFIMVIENRSAGSLSEALQFNYTRERGTIT